MTTSEPLANVGGMSRSAKRTADRTSPHPSVAPIRAEIRKKLLDWYRTNRRDLPWRRTTDPYRVWISEVMLQQTRVETVLPYYERFLERWPTVDALAAADPSDVRAVWSGLGYYRRAQLMLSAAAQLARDHDGRLPGDADALRKLPGFGRYTAGAVASIAFGLERPAVDGNVQRVLARAFGIEGDVSVGAANARVWEEAEALARGEAPGDFNQALIELGATVCTPRNPRCLVCPVRDRCAARAAGRERDIPPPRKRAERSFIECTALVLLDDDRGIVLERQPATGLFADLWCLPTLEGHLEEDQARDEAERKYGWSLSGSLEGRGEVKHVLTHRDILMRLYLARVGSKRPLRLGGDALARIALDALGRIALPSLTARALKAGLPKDVVTEIELPGRKTKAGRRRASRDAAS